MRAFRCDRCGNYFNKIPKAEKIVVKMVSQSLVRSIENDDVDLCPDCQKALDSWWINKEAAEI